jgi:hypothetical protein
VFSGGEGGHEEDPLDFGSSAAGWAIGFGLAALLGVGGETCETCEGSGLAAGERAEVLLGAVAARGEKEIDRPRGVRFDLRAQGG